MPYYNILYKETIYYADEIEAANEDEAAAQIDSLIRNGYKGFEYMRDIELTAVNEIDELAQ